MQSHSQNRRDIGYGNILVIRKGKDIKAWQPYK